jgi:hypothetical protein
MFNLPKFKKCPSCDSTNLIRINGVSYENKFSSLSEWTLKKKFNCRKCRVELGLFLHNSIQNQKLIWLDVFECEEKQLNDLNKLEKNRIKYRAKRMNKDFKNATKQIQAIQNKIRLDQAKIKIKVKLQNRHY